MHDPTPDIARSSMARAVAIGQGLYFFLTGVWPFAHLRSFLRVTGPKVDVWLVETVGALVAAVGVALLIAGVRRRVTVEIALLGLFAAGALGAVETPYALTGRIRAVYLADAAVEAAFVTLWAVALVRARRAQRG